MTRPIPEGVVPPRPNTVIQGWGCDFIVPAEGFSGWMSSDNGLSWVEGAGLRGADPDSLYAAPFLSDVNILNAPSLETSLVLAPGSFGKFIKGMEEKAIKESEEYFSNLRSKINEAAPADSEVARLNREATDEEAFLPIPEGFNVDKDALIRELVAKWRQSAKICSDRGRAMAFEKCADDLEDFARTTCTEAFGGCNETPADGR